MRTIVKIVLPILLFIGIDRGIGFMINQGLERYFGLNQHSKVLFLGHSHLMLAVDKSKFEDETGVKVSKYCREGVNVADRYVMLKHFLSLPYSDSLKYVIYGVDQFMFTGKGLSQNSYMLFYPFMDNKAINSYIRESTSVYDYWLHKLICSTRYSDALLNSSIRGWLRDWSNYKIGQLDVETLRKQIEGGKQRHIDFDPDLIEAFENTLSLLKQKGIITILVNTPIAQILNEYEPLEYQKIISYLQSQSDSTNVYYWDLNPEFSGKYDLLFDPIHLNVEGQQVINSVLANKFQLLNHAQDFRCNSSL